MQPPSLIAAEWELWRLTTVQSGTEYDRRNDVAIENERVLIGLMAAPGITCACTHPEKRGHAPWGRTAVKYFQLDARKRR